MNSRILFYFILFYFFIFLLNPATTVMLMKWLGVEAMALSPLRIECKLLLFVHQSF